MAPKRGRCIGNFLDTNGVRQPVFEDLGPHGVQCPECIEEAHQQIRNNPCALSDVDRLQQAVPALTLGEAILASRNNYYDLLFNCLEEMKAEHGKIPCWLRYHLALGMTQAQKMRLEAL